MSLYPSSLALLKIYTEGNYQTIAGLRRHELRIQQQSVNASDMLSGKWQRMAAGAGLQQATLVAEGVFADSDAEHALLTRVLDGSLAQIQLQLPNGGIFSGEFLIVDYKRVQVIDGEEGFAIRLISSGPCSYS